MPSAMPAAVRSHRSPSTPHRTSATSARCRAVASLRALTTRHSRRLLLALGVLAVTHVIVGIDSDVLLALPALLFVLPLLAGRYVGEDRLARLAAAFVPTRSRATGATPTSARRGPRSLPRGGCLIAASLAVRPPPPPSRLMA